MITLVVLNFCKNIRFVTRYSFFTTTTRKCYAFRKTKINLFELASCHNKY